MAEERKRYYIFDVFRIDTLERVLLREGRIIPLAPKAFDTLLTLVENSGRTLTKEELMRAVWSDTFVEEANLAQNISLIRKALNESPNENRFIQTVPRRGYRFLPSVEVLNEESDVVGKEQSGVLKVNEREAGLTIRTGIKETPDQDKPGLSSKKPRPKNWFQKSLLATVGIILLLVAVFMILTRLNRTSVINDPVHISDFAILTDPVAGRQFYIRINGSGFDPDTARVVVMGTGCPANDPCNVPIGALRQFGEITSTRIEVVPLTLGPGTFQIFVQNGTAGPKSNAIQLTVTFG